MFSEMWSKRKCSIESSCTSSSGTEQGLRILTKISIPNSNQLVVIKPIFLLKKSESSSVPAAGSDDDDCYLKYCSLCMKPLNLEKEIYMYRGDLGFCSVECRERQIYMDETREMEANTKRILSTFGGRCESETTKLLEEFRRRRRRHPAFSSTTRERVVFSYS